MAEYILRDQAIIAVTGAKLPDVSASGLPIANGKRSVTDCVRRLKEIPAADVRPVVKAYWIDIWSDLDRTTSMKARCSNCGNTSMRPVGGFCKWCGADMREES